MRESRSRNDLEMMGSPRTVASRAAVPLFSQAAGETDAAAALVIFVILSILSIPLLPFPQLDRSRCRLATRNSGQGNGKKTGWTGLTG